MAEDTTETEDSDLTEEQLEQMGITGDVDADAPDPSDLEPISKEEAEYQRDADGELKTVYHAIQYEGEWRRVGVKPLVPGEANELEETFNSAGSFSMDEITPFLEEFIREPEDVNWSDAKLSVIRPCTMALNKEIFGGGNDEFTKQVIEAIEERDSGQAGN